MLSKDSQQEKNKQKFPKRISSKVPVNITIHTRNSNSQKFEKNSYEYSFTKPIPVKSYSKKIDNPYSSSYHSYFTLGQTPSTSSSSSSNTTQRAYYNNNNDDDDIHKNKKDDKEDDNLDESVTLSILNSKEYARKLISASKDNFEFEYEKDYKKKDNEHNNNKNSKNSTYDKNIYNSNKYIVSELVFSPEESPIIIPEKPSNNSVDMSRSVLFKHSNSSSESLSSTGSKNGPKRRVSLKNTRNSINLTRKRSSSIGNKPRNRSNSASVGNRKVSPNQEFEDFPFLNSINRNNSLDEQSNNRSLSLPRRIEIRDVRNNNKVEKRNRSNTLPRSMIISPVKDEKFSYSLPKMEFHSVQDFPVPRVVGYDIRNNFSPFDYDKDKDKDKDKDYIYTQDLISPTVSEYVEYRTLLKSDNLDLNSIDEREERRHRSLSRKGESRYRSLSRDEKRRSSRSRSRQRGREHNTSPSNNVDGESRYRSLSRTRNEPREDKEIIYEYMDNKGNRDYERERERKDSNRERNYNEYKDSIRDRNNYERHKSESRDKMSYERRKSESRDKMSYERRKSESRDKTSHERHKSESRSRDHGDRERSRGRDHERRRSSSRHKKSSSCCHKKNKSLSESPLPKNSQIITNSNSSSSSPHPMNSQIITNNTTSSPLPMNSQIIANSSSSNPLPINNQIITNSSRGSPLSKANNTNHSGSPLAINTNVINNKFSTAYIQNGSMNKSYLDEKNNSNNKYMDISTQKISTSFNNSNSFANKPFGSMDNEDNTTNKINTSINNSRIDEIHDLKKFSQDFSGLKILEDILNKPLEEDLDFSTMNRRLYRNKNPSYPKFSTISRLPSQNRNNSYDYNRRRNSDTNYPFDFEKGHNRVNSDQSRNIRNNEENGKSKSKNIFNFFSNHKKSKSYSSINFDNNDNNNNKMRTSEFDKMIKGNDTIKLKLKPSNKICSTPYLTNEEGFVNDDIFTDVSSKDYEGNFKSFLSDKKKNKKGSFNQPINNIKDYMPLFRINMMDNSMGKKKYKDDFMEQYGAYNNKNDTNPFNHFNDNDGNNRKSQRGYNKYGSLKRSY